MKEETAAGAFATLALLAATVCGAWLLWPLPELLLVGATCLVCDVATACLALSD